METEKIVKEYIGNTSGIVLADTGHGDGGKAKVADFLLENMPSGSIFCKATGGNNSGNTNGKGVVYNSVPIGFEHGGHIESYLGPGALLNVTDFLEEVRGHHWRMMRDYGRGGGSLDISFDCPLILPHHIILDKELNTSQKNGGVGSTGKGIGPAYSDRASRVGLLVKHIFDEDGRAIQLEKLKKHYEYLGYEIDIDEISNLLNLAPGDDAIIRNRATNVTTLFNEKIRRGRKALLMGGQGFGLSNIFGSYPYTTATDTSVYGIRQGSGLSHDFDFRVLNLFQTPLVTKVGGGSLEFEIGGSDSQKYCEDTSKTLESELETYHIPFTNEDGRIVYDQSHETIKGLMNSKDEFEMSIGLRLYHRNYGVTSGRPRRFAWQTITNLNDALEINGGDTCLTKLDFGHNMPYIRLGIDHYGNYEEFEGFGPYLNSVKKYQELPLSARKYVSRIEELSGSQIKFISIGPKTQDIIPKS